MITVITEFAMPQPLTLEEAQSIFSSTAPNYLNIQGLLRKTYIFSDDEKTLGGIYFWNSRQEAEAAYTEEWRAVVRKKYGVDPKVSYFESPVVVDCVGQQIIAE